MASTDSGQSMSVAQYLIIAAGAFAAGLALGPVIGRRSRRLTAALGFVVAVIGAALMWPPTRSVLIETLAFDELALDLGEAGFFGIAVALLSLAFGAAITDS
jgi:hypothetical protein